MNSGVFYYNVWKALSDSPFYDKYATIFDQVKINCVKVQIQAYTSGGHGSYVLSAAFDRNGLSSPVAGITEEKISSYSSARNIMVSHGTKNVLYISNYPVTMVEKSQYVPTALIPNIAAGTVDDNADETASSGSMTWPYKPILLVANK